MTGWISHLLAFVAGIGTGMLLAGRGHRLVGRRRGRRRSDKKLRELYRVCPKFFDELRGELSRPEFQSVREFAIVESAQVTFVSEDVKFVCYEDEMPQLREVAAALEDEGFIDEVTRGRTPLYRMRETFITALGFL